MLDWFFLVFVGAAALATLALFTRQPLLVAYIAIGGILGPSGAALVSDPSVIAEISEIGIIFLLFLLGLDMQPSSLARQIRETTLVGLASCLAFAGFGTGVALLAGLPMAEALLVGAASMFSSTIIGIKLLPTTVLHHRHVGQLVVSVLLLQDLVAIVLLLIIGGGGGNALLGPDVPDWLVAGLPLIALPLTIAGAFLAVRWLVLPLIARFDAFHEFIFLLAIGWCMGLAMFSEHVGLSLEIGGFLAGVALATSPISQYIAESLRPLRDFFLILFFFSVGASFDLTLLDEVLLPALLLATGVMLLKPATFRLLLGWQKEPAATGWEVGFRLGQMSEFSLLLAYLALEQGLLTIIGSHLIQAAAIFTFLVSSYLVVFRYPSPIAPNAALRRD